ncbi:TPA: restriction endonuclease subunit M [Neisseria meningitidis]
MVHLSEIAAQDYNLNLPRYIDSGEVEDLQNHDMDSLEAYWQVLGRMKNELFAEHDGRFTTIQRNRLQIFPTLNSLKSCGIGVEFRANLVQPQI